MSPRALRLVYACEFLLALVAIFTAWSEIGGQAALDLMHWTWKLGLSFALAAAFVAYTAALVTEEAVWSLRSARWLTAIAILLLAMGAITYFYQLQVDSGDSDRVAALKRSSRVIREAVRILKNPGKITCLAPLLHLSS